MIRRVVFLAVAGICALTWVGFGPVAQANVVLTATFEEGHNWNENPRGWKYEATGTNVDADTDLWTLKLTGTEAPSTSVYAVRVTVESGKAEVWYDVASGSPNFNIGSPFQTYSTFSRDYYSGGSVTASTVGLNLGQVIGQVSAGDRALTIWFGSGDFNALNESLVYGIDVDNENAVVRGIPSAGYGSIGRGSANDGALLEVWHTNGSAFYYNSAYFTGDTNRKAHADVTLTTATPTGLPPVPVPLPAALFLGGFGAGLVVVVRRIRMKKS